MFELARRYIKTGFIFFIQGLLLGLYSPRLAEVIYWFLTLGTAVRFTGEIISSYITLNVINWLIVLGGIGQVLAGFLFVYNIWSRVRPVGKQT